MVFDKYDTPAAPAKTSQAKKSSRQAADISTGLIISNDNLFVDKLNNLKELRKQLPTEINLPSVKTDAGLFGWFEHNVTGKEFNCLTENVQDRIIEQDKTLIKLVKEISAIYDVFTALDKVYVQEIVIAINAAFKAIDAVRDANERISRQQSDISAAQQDIKQVINQQKQIIQVLKSFKEKLEKLKHLYDIDETFNEVHTYQTKTETLEQASAEQKINIDKISAILESLSASNDIHSENIRKMHHTFDELKKESSDLEIVVAQVKKDQKTTAKAAKNIEKVQKTFEKSLEAQKTDIIHVSTAQKEFTDALSLLQEADEALSENLIQLVRETEQRFSEFERDAEKRNNEFIKSASSFQAAVKKCEQDVQDFHSEVNLEIAQISSNSCKQYEAVKNELTALRSKNAELFQSLALFRGISIAGLASSLVLLILFLTGVLR